MRFPLLFISIVCFLCATGYAATAPESFAVAKVISGNELTLTDGRCAKLAGIAAPWAATGELADQARDALRALTGAHKLALEGDAMDRYGCVAAQIYTLQDDGKKIWLQGEMLRQGLAFVYPPTGDEPRLDEMLALETQARRNKQGIWADAAYADTPAIAARAKEGHFAFVSGLVLDAARVKNMVYLNFGPDWRTDFTIAIAAHDLHNFRNANIDPLSYKGKTIRVRGWIKRDYGPMITVTAPGQIGDLSPKK